jgi:hypothetical protein
MCDTGAIAACRTTVKSWLTANVAAPARAPEPIAARVQTGSGGPSSRLQIQLQLQRTLFTRGGRLAPVDVLVDAAGVSPPTERTSRVPIWATKLRAARIDNEKARR